MKTIAEIVQESRQELDGLEAVAKGDFGDAVVLTGVCQQSGVTGTLDGKLVQLWSKGTDVPLHGDHMMIQKMYGKYAVTVIFRKVE